MAKSGPKQETASILDSLQFLYIIVNTGGLQYNMIAAKISAKGQITLPKRVRQALAVKPGEHVVFVVEDKTVWVRPLGRSSARALAGSLGRYAGDRPKGSTARQAVKKEVARAAAEEN